jgi:rhodanese-related sulfurtransferase/DNA-binding transcriptional ArsR family regulator
MQPREFKDQLYEHLARMGKATSSPKRLELLDLLAQGERPVEALADLTALSLANTSRHLQVLKEARLVESRKEGLNVFYRLAGPEVLAFIATLRSVAENRLAELNQVVRRYLGSRDELEPVSRETLVQRLRAGDVTVVDVRPGSEFDAGHIPGAVCIPIDELRRRLAEVPRRKQVVAYCRGPYCVYSYQAVEILRAAGRSARRLIDGLPEWKAAGLPVEIVAAEEAR